MTSQRASALLGVILFFVSSPSSAQSPAATTRDHLDALMDTVSEQVEKSENALLTFENAYLALKLVLERKNDTLIA
ncbi:MAG: hypothetical protein WA960_03025 [Tunicatimonas sp.]